MEQIFAYLNGVTLDEETFILTAIFAATTLIIVTVVLFAVGSRSPIRKGLMDIRNQMNDNAGAEAKASKVDHTLESLAPFIAPRNKKEKESVRLKLMHAGFHDANAMTIFYAIKVLSLVIGLFVAMGIFFFNNDMPFANVVMLFAVFLGLFFPNMVLHKLVKNRQRKIRNAIPDALDLLVVCTESGLGFNAALNRVAQELDISHPEFSDELDTVCLKVKSGVELNHAFEDLVRRTGVTEITGLVKMLAHASRIGGSLAQTLREYTEDYRDRRNQELEEIAAKIPTKMIFPLLLFIWPCFFIVAVGPSILTLLDTLSS
ncbi:type II secretion system F family protein [Vibrio sp.]|nr:type II secretion system F family protein [Vibrio sp.]